MAINIGSSSINNIYLGNIRVKSVYLGDKLVYNNQPFEIVTGEDSYNIYTFNTSKVSNSTTVTLQNDRAGDTTQWDGLTYWGDGTVDTELTHTYAKNGTYTVKTKYTINDTTNYASDSNGDSNTRKMLISCDNLNWNATNYFSAFCFCKNLTYVNVSRIRTSQVKNMSYMFRACDALTTIDLSTWDVSNVTDMSNMFYNCYKTITINISGWNTGNVIDMSDMFNGCSALTNLDLSNLDTSKLMHNSYMFYGCKLLTTLDLSTWNTSNIVNIIGCFYGCSALSTLNISNWNMDNVEYYDYMFKSCTNLTIDNITMTNCNSATKKKIQKALNAA